MTATHVISPSHVDSGFAYVILISCFLLRVLESFHPVNFGIYLLEFMDYFNADNALSIAFLGGIYPLSQAISGPVHGYCVKRFGAKSVVAVASLVYSVSSLVAASFPSIEVLAVYFAIAGFCGMGLILAGQIIVQQYFDKKRSLAAGVWMSGASWGFFIWPPVARHLIKTYTWRGSYYIYAGIILNGIVCAGVLRPPSKNAKSANKKDDTGFKLSMKCELKYLNWFLFLLGVVLLAMGQFAGAVYFPVKGHQEGVEKSKIPFLISVIGITGVFLRPFSGFLGDLKCTNRQILSGTTMTLSGLTFIVAAQVFGFPPLMAVAAVSGIMQSLYSSTLGAQVVDVFTLDNIELGSGLFSSSFGLGLCTLNPIAGVLIDAWGSTDIVFYVFGGAHIVGGFIFIIVSKLTAHLIKTRTTSDINPKLRAAVSMESVY